jgi:hypothetical protein
MVSKLTRCIRNPPSVATESGSAVGEAALGAAPEERLALGPDLDTAADADLRAGKGDVAFGLGSARSGAPGF